jgi:ribosomal protein S21
MSKEELVLELQKLRESRRRGYTQTPRVNRKRKDSAFSDMDEELAAKLLELLDGGLE